MNISTAAIYMKKGYRVRRACWEPEEYISGIGDMLDKMEVYYLNIWDDKQRKIIEHRRIHSAGICQFEPEDLLADDWEIITTGIRKQFDEYGNIEYDDETDSDDNYEGWYGEEEE